MTTSWRSPSSRRAWIEIPSAATRQRRATVALLAEGVDRNDSVRRSRCVALVALLAEGVDRNKSILDINGEELRSPSSRRAWIEMMMNWARVIAAGVALLAEGVDRNSARVEAPAEVYRRPPRGGRG